MNEQLSLLIQLQELDGRIRAHQDEKKRIPEQLAAFEQRTLANKAELDTVRESLETAQKAKRDRDRDLDEGGRKVEKLKGRTSEIKTNKEYQALLKEIETAEQENRTIEDDILKLMELIDAAAAEIKNAEKRSAEEDAAIQEERKRLEADRKMIDGSLAEVERLRGELLSRIDAAVMAEYRRLAGIAGGKIVVEVRGESCSGCYMSIPPRTFVSVKKNDSIIACPHCHRILYYKEAIVESNT
jgi:predicted  nucleic acid-binding Zn-ribbon protein